MELRFTGRVTGTSSGR